MRIGELARQAGVTVDTVRFYERRGLLRAPLRSVTGYRRYSTRAVQQMLFIAEAKRLGFTLREIDGLLGRDVDCDGLRARADAKIADIDRRMRELRSMRRALRQLARTCEARAAGDACRVRRTLDQVSR